MNETPITQDARRVSRIHSYRGQRVTVELNDGTTLTGTLDGWGAHWIRVRTEAGRIERSTALVWRVRETAA
jgi:hypothetical protein